MDRFTFEHLINDSIILMNTLNNIARVISGNGACLEGLAGNAIDRLIITLVEEWCREYYPNILNDDHNFCCLLDGVFNTVSWEFDFDDFIYHCEKLNNKEKD